MRKKVIICSFIAAALLTLGSFVSVVGYQSAHVQEQAGSSPLFVVQTQRATQKEDSDCISSYLGKGEQVNIFPVKSQQSEMIEKAIQLFSANPGVLSTLLKKLDNFPALHELLTKHGIDANVIKSYIRMLKNNPELLIDGITDLYQQKTLDDGPQPLGLSTSNPLGCVIVAIFALVPLTVVLTLLLLFFTLRILTCLNINDCANTLANQIWQQVYQGLSPG
ncbi:MAG: hypothetical protein JW840_06370 [Candidatus Thermoplasmatota archaeon]|nr:hypothetical protein [Candidatus Thermoplasmatota archaeon]